MSTRTKLNTYLEIIRFPLFPIPIVTTLSGVALARGSSISWKGYTVLVIAMIGYFAGMLKNDYFHSEKDALVNPQKPIPSGRISRRRVFFSASTIYIVCLLTGLLLNYKAGLMVAALIVLSHLYNAMFKGKGILGSITLPLGIALMSVFGSIAVSGRAHGMVWYCFAGIFLYDFGAHIATTFKDIDQDRETGIISTPIQIGIRPALALSTLATIGAFVVMALPYVLGKANPNYLIWVGLSVGTTIITRLPLLIKQDQGNGYLALKGSMIGAIALYPCLIGTVFSINVCFFVIMIPYLLSTVLLETTSQRV
ncbi:UbiA family prenyltransferase [Candidatus Poribacteria bacterium]